MARDLINATVTTLAILALYGAFCLVVSWALG